MVGRKGFTQRRNKFYMSVAFEQIKDQTTIGDKVVALKQGQFREQKNPHPSILPSIQSWGVSCFNFFQVARTAAQHCMEGMGEEKLYFPLSFEVGKTSESPFRAVSQPIWSPIAVKACLFSFHVRHALNSKAKFSSHSQQVFWQPAGSPSGW